MSRSKKVTINSLIIGSQHVVVNLISIFVVGYVARALGESDYGVFSLAFTFPQFFMIIGNFGTRSVAIREMARDRENAISFLGSILPMRFVLLFCMLFLTPLAAYWMGYEGTPLLVISLATVSLVIELLARIIFDVFQAFEKMGNIAVRDIAIRLFTGVTSVLVLLFGYGLVEVCYVYVAGAVLGLIINLIVYKKQFPWPTIKLDKQKSIEILKLSAPFALTGFISALYYKVDILMLSIMVGDSEVGIYNASANIIYRLTFIADAIATASFPAIAQLFWVDKRRTSQIINNSVMMVLILSIPVVVGGFILSEKIIVLIYGDTYLQSASIFRLLIVTIPFMFVNVLYSYILGAIKKQNIVLIVSVFLAVINIFVNLLLIPRLASTGAAIATLTTEIVSTILYSVFVISCVSIGLSWRTIGAVLLSVTTMGWVVHCFRDSNIFISISIGAICYLFLFSFLAEEKYNVIVKVLNKYR